MERKKTTRTRLELFKAVFRGRQDRYMGYHTCIDKPLTDDVLREHLSGHGFKRVGIFPLAPDILDGSGTWWVVADIDNEDLDGAIKIKESLSGYGIASYLEISKRGRFHTWVFFTEPVLAVAARNLMKRITEFSGANYHRIFPTTDSIAHNDADGFIYLPLFGGSIIEDRTVFLNPTNNHKPYRDQWKFLGSIHEVEPELLYQLCDSLGLDKGFPAAGDPHNEPAS